MPCCILKIAYKGTNYCGWQVQPGLPTVQNELQNACEKAFGFRPDITGCSRTDSGVHAKEFIAKADAETHIPPENIPLAINRYLPDDISVISADIGDDGFHPRYDAKGKEYIYTVRNSNIRDPFTDDFVWLYGKKIDTRAAEEMCKEFIGTHDFKAFMAAGSKISDTVRTVKYFDVTQDGSDIYFRVAADGFLYNMVRIMVGTVVSAASGTRLLPIKAIIESKDRSNAGLTAPAKGLCLNKVFY